MSSLFSLANSDSSCRRTRVASDWHSKPSTCLWRHNSWPTYSLESQSKRSLSCVFFFFFVLFSCLLLFFVWFCLEIFFCVNTHLFFLPPLLLVVVVCFLWLPSRGAQGKYGGWELQVLLGVEVGCGIFFMGPDFWVSGTSGGWMDGWCVRWVIAVMKERLERKTVGNDENSSGDSGEACEFQKVVRELWEGGWNCDWVVGEMDCC